MLQIFNIDPLTQLVSSKHKHLTHHQILVWKKKQQLYHRTTAFYTEQLHSSFLSNRWLLVVLDRKSSQEYPVNTGVPQGSILGPTLFLLDINDLPNDVICNIAIYADDTTLYSKCDQASDL